MGNVKVIGSDYYAEGKAHNFSGKTLSLVPKPTFGSFSSVMAAVLGTGLQRVKIKDITIAEVTEESVKKFGGAAAFGVTGGFLFGPAGLIAGAIMGGNKKTHTLIIETEKGKALIEISAKVYKQMIASQL